MKLSYQEFELALDCLLLNSRPPLKISIYDLPQRTLLAAYHEGLPPEDFMCAYLADKKAAFTPSSSQDQASLF